MNKHRAKYLTHKSKSLRQWVSSRIDRTDQRYEVIEEEADFIPNENQYCFYVRIFYKGLKQIKSKVLYCEILDCDNNNLVELPKLPVCKELNCGDNKLTKLPSLPVCEYLDCAYNKLTELPDLPVCEYLDCGNNPLTKVP